MKKETPENGTHKVYYGPNRKSDTPFNGSTEIEKNYKNGLLHGKLIQRGDIVYQGKNSSGQMQYSGRLEYECNYKNGLKDGIEVYFHHGGEYKEREFTYKDDLLNGKTTFWGSPTSHIKESEINYKNNLLHGKSITWFGNREKDSERNYKNGKKDGKFIHWYYNKQKKSEEIYENDVLKGKPLYWYPNGKDKDENVVVLERRDEEEEWGQEYWVYDTNYDQRAEYEKNYEGYDKFSDGTIEGFIGDPFGDLGDE